MMAAIEQALGPQTITVAGVPDTSHFARVLVAADYRMKRLAMGFEEPPMTGLPSFLQMMKSAPGRARAMMPRWWLAPDYDALLSDAEGLAFEFGKAGVQAMTEEQAVDSAGQKRSAGHENPLAKKWADNMTARYEALSTKDTIFGQLRNCMDLAVVAALDPPPQPDRKVRLEHAAVAESRSESRTLPRSPPARHGGQHRPQGERLDHHRLGRRADQSLAAPGKNRHQARSGRPTQQGHRPHHRLVVELTSAGGSGRNWR